VKITERGCSFKLYCDDEAWRGPHHILKELPQHMPKLLTEFDGLKEESLEHLTEFTKEYGHSFDAEESKYYADVLAGRTGLSSYPSSFPRLPANNNNNNSNNGNKTNNTNNGNNINSADRYFSHPRNANGILIEATSNDLPSKQDDNTLQLDNLNVRFRMDDDMLVENPTQTVSTSRFRIVSDNVRTAVDGTKIPVYKVLNYPELGIDSWLDAKEIAKNRDIQFVLDEYLIVNNYKNLRKESKEAVEQRKKKKESEEKKHKKRKEKKKKKVSSSSSADDAKGKSKSQGPSAAKKRSISVIDNNNSNNNSINSSNNNSTGSNINRVFPEFSVGERVKLEFSTGVPFEFRECCGTIRKKKENADDGMMYFKIDFEDGDKESSKKWWSIEHLFKIVVKERSSPSLNKKKKKDL
jgi:hypothetical protein